MKYKKNQYSEGVSICGLIIAGAFIWWGISSLINLEWWGLITFGIGIAILSSQIFAITNKKKLRNTVKYEIEGNPNATVEEISASTGISEKDVRAIILDLKANGELRGKFSSKTGQLKMVSAEAQPQEKDTYCPSCGTKVKQGAQFCAFCGAKIE